MGFFDSLVTTVEQFFNEREQNNIKEKQENKKKSESRFKKIMENHSLTCNKCTGVAEPIIGTGDRYHCRGCGRKFVGAGHGIYRRSDFD